MSEKYLTETIEKLKKNESEILDLSNADYENIDSDSKKFKEFLQVLEKNVSIKKVQLISLSFENEENFIKLIIALKRRHCQILSVDVAGLILSANGADFFFEFLENIQTLEKFHINSEIDFNEKAEDILFEAIPKIVANNSNLRSFSIFTGTSPTKMQIAAMFNFFKDSKIKNLVFHSPTSVFQDVGVIIGSAICKMKNLSTLGISIHPKDAEAVIDGISLNRNIVRTSLNYGESVKPQIIDKFVEMIASTPNIIKCSIEPCEDFTGLNLKSNYYEALKLAKTFYSHEQLQIPLDYETAEAINQREAAVRYLLEHEVRPKAIATPAPPQSHQERLAGERQAASSSQELGV